MRLALTANLDHDPPKSELVAIPPDPTAMQRETLGQLTAWYSFAEGDWVHVEPPSRVDANVVTPRCESVATIRHA
jgi:hypothetical protein